MSIDRMGVIETRPAGKRKTQSEQNMRRCAKIGKELHGLARAADLICVEAMSYPPSSMSAHKMGLAWGVLAVCREDNELPMLHVTPQQIKEAVTGGRSANKDKVQETLVKVYPEAKEQAARWPQGKREHMFDALGAIHACLDHDVIRMGVRRDT